MSQMRFPEAVSKLKAFAETDDDVLVFAGGVANSLVGLDSWRLPRGSGHTARAPGPHLK